MNVEEMKTVRGLIDEYMRLCDECGNAHNNEEKLCDKLNDAERNLKQVEKERDNEVEDNNRLREENANLHNQVTELTTERDEARRKLFEWARFINFTVYTALDAAVKSKRCRPIVKDTVDAMIHFKKQNPITLTEGGMAV